MRKMNTVVSAVNAYSLRLGSSYMDIAYESDNVQKEVTQMQMRVQQAEEDVGYQLAQASELHHEASSKASHFASMRDAAQAEAASAQAEIDYVLSNPIPVTQQDADGNTYTEYVIDQAALAAAESRYQHAMMEYQYYEAKYRDAQLLEAEASAACARFEALQKAIGTVNNMIQEQSYRISQYSREIQFEANYNLRCMRSILDRMNEYLACKQIYLPERPV